MILSALLRRLPPPLSRRGGGRIGAFVAWDMRRLVDMIGAVMYSDNDPRPPWKYTPLGSYTFMWLLRYFLMAVSAIALGFIVYGYMDTRPYESNVRLVMLGIGSLLVLNFIYLFACPPFGTRPKSRLLKLGSLWFDAKESELRQRAKQSQDLK
jgi:hypothetical protein